MPRPKTLSDEAVLDATFRVVGRVGPTRLTLAAVAVEAGLAPATLVQRFGSKRALLLELDARAAAAARRQLRVCAASTALETLVDNLVALAAPVGDPVAFSNHLAMLHQDLSDPEFHAHARSHARAMREEIQSLLQRAAAETELDPRVKLEQLARSIQTAYNGALITWAIERDGPLEPWLRRELQAVLAPWRTRI